MFNPLISTDKKGNSCSILTKPCTDLSSRRDFCPETWFGSKVNFAQLKRDIVVKKAVLPRIIFSIFTYLRLIYT